MAHIEKHAPGVFCWAELATTDQDAAKLFYSELFGWKIFDSPMGPGDFYTMFSLEGQNTSAACTLRPELKAMGVPPHWMLYINVANVDEAAAKVTAAGGLLRSGPFDVMTYGRMAVAADSTGATFCIWEDRDHTGIGITGVHGTLCWADLMTRDVPKASQFYTDVFGWSYLVDETTPGHHGYLHIKNGETLIGGMPPSEHMPPGVPAHWMLYFQATDCAASTEKAVALGAKVHMGPMVIEKVGTITILDDPQGAGFALFTPQPR